MKVDVQGGELNVLLGGQALIRKYGIDMMYLEFSGDHRILDFLQSNKYILFDTDYLIIPNVGFSWERLESHGIFFANHRVIDLSTGKKAYLANLAACEPKYVDLFSLVRKNFAYIQTDLVCVHEDYIRGFIENVYQVISSTKENSN